MILVTGSSGFIGSNFVKSRPEGETVIGVDMSHRYSPPNMKKVSMDLTKPGDVSFLDGYEFDSVVHTAAIISPKKCQEEPLKAYMTNIVGTLNMLEAARKHDVSKFIYVSTGGVYRNSSSKATVGEDWEKDPSGFYSISKITSEQTVNEYARDYGISSAAIRITAPYGPGMVPPGTRLTIPDALHRHTLLFASRIIQGKDIIMPYGGDHTVNYTYVGDIVEGITRALNSTFKGFEPFNITSGKAFTIRELGEAFSALNPSVKVDIGPGTLVDSRAVDDPLLAPLRIVQGTFDISKAANMLGYSPAYSLEQGVSNLVEYMKNNDVS